MARIHTTSPWQGQHEHQGSGSSPEAQASEELSSHRDRQLGIAT